MRCQTGTMTPVGGRAPGGPRRSPREAADALAEWMEVIRSVWDPCGGPQWHYRVVGLHPGPAPAHRVETRLGAYRQRMLRLTGASADGWLPAWAMPSRTTCPR